MLMLVMGYYDLRERADFVPLSSWLTIDCFLMNNLLLAMLLFLRLFAVD